MLQFLLSLSCFSELYFCGSKLQRAMVARIAKVELSFLSLAVSLQFGRTGIMALLSPDRLETSWNSRDSILIVTSVPIEERLSAGILWFLVRMDVNQVTAIVAIAHSCQIDWSRFGQQNSFLFKCDKSVLIIF